MRALAKASVEAEGPFAKVDALVAAPAEVMGPLAKVRADEPEATSVSSASRISVNSSEEESELLIAAKLLKQKSKILQSLNLKELSTKQDW